MILKGNYPPSQKGSECRQEEKSNRNKTPNREEI
jgi:hypothetical protein